VGRNISSILCSVIVYDVSNLKKLLSSTGRCRIKGLGHDILGNFV